MVTETDIKKEQEEILASYEIDANRIRLLLAGFPGAGKSTALYSLAEIVMVEDPDARIFCLDFDRGMGKIRPEWPGVDNITFYRGRNWQDVQKFMDEVGPIQRPRDFVYLDMIGKAWEMAQSFEISMVHEASAGMKLLEARQAMVKDKKVNAPATFLQPDWQVIKRLHNDEFVDKICDDWDAHVIATTSLDPVDKDRDDHLITSIFGAYGYKPDGEKRNGHRFDTVMYVEHRGRRRLLHTLKDRGKPTLSEVEIKGRSIWEAYGEALKEKGFSWRPDSLGG